MGFDDSLFDADAVEKVLDMLTKAGSLSYYVHDHFKPAMTKAALERCEAESVQYHGYSLAFNMILPLMKVCGLGMTPFLTDDCGFAQLRTRELVLTRLLDCGDIQDAAFLASVREQIAVARALVEEIRGTSVQRAQDFFQGENNKRPAIAFFCVL